MPEEDFSSAGNGRTKWPWRFPPGVGGIQINHCKNPKCANFGAPPFNERKRDRSAQSSRLRLPGDYIVTATGKKAQLRNASSAGKYFRCKAIWLSSRSCYASLRIGNPPGQSVTTLTVTWLARRILKRSASTRASERTDMTRPDNSAVAA